MRRVARSSPAAEIQQAVNTNDEIFAARLLWSELNGETPERTNRRNVIYVYLQMGNRRCTEGAEIEKPDVA